METLLLNCLQATIIASRIKIHPQLSPEIKNELLWELKQGTQKKCNIDANLPKERETDHP